MPPVRSIALVAVLVAAPLAALTGAAPMPAHAQEAEDPTLPEQMERALRDMMGDVRPKLDDALDYLRSFGAIDDPLNYEMPEVLPNGDIIMRRREDAPEFHPDARDEPGPPAENLPYDPEEGIRT